MSARAPENARGLFAPLATTTGKVQWLGVAILAAITLAAVFAPLVSPHAPDEAVCRPFLKPRMDHPLGCNDAGQDLLSQLLYGGRISLAVGLAVAALSTFVAVLVAIVAGFHGGWIDRLLMRFVDVVLSLPFLPLVIVLGVFFGASMTTQIAVISLVMWAPSVRELRAQILQIRAAGFVEASLAMGGGALFIGRRHILPELAPLIVPQFVRIAHSAILVETSLSFLGLGDPLSNSWGSILYHANARTAFLTGAWINWVLPPGLTISVTVLALAFIGFGYNASLAPRIALSRKTVRSLTPGDAPQEGAALTVNDLHVAYASEHGLHAAVRGVSLALKPGGLLGLVGESGSGKTTVSMAILRLLRPSAQVSAGSVWLGGDELLSLPDGRMQALRGRRIALIPQSAMNALNPVLTIGDQIGEALAMRITNASERRKAAAAWLEKVGLRAGHLKSYPHELSGGMRQRAVIAIALCNDPEVVIADEPTTGLDVLVQEEIMALLMTLRRDLNLSILFVTHNLPLIARHADELLVMYRGEIVDRGTPADLRRKTAHAHTQALFDNLPELGAAKRWPAETGDGEGERMPVLELADVSKTFARRRAFGAGQTHRAIDGVTLRLMPGERLGLVGGSGAGKSTLARILMGIVRPDAGRVLFDGRDVADEGRTGWKAMRRAAHIVFQDPYNSMRNGMAVRDVVAEPLRLLGMRDEMVVGARVVEALEAVRLPFDAAFLSRLPVALSGGQRQRLAFARAIVARPRVIIADEPTSMLDQSIRMEIMDLMEDLRRRYGTSFLFITHDIVLARHFCDRVAVLQNGRIVEEGPADAVIGSPVHAYTRRLIEAA